MIVGSSGRPVKHFMQRYRRAKYAVRGGGGVKSCGHPHGTSGVLIVMVMWLSMGARFGKRLLLRGAFHRGRRRRDTPRCGNRSKPYRKKGLLMIIRGSSGGPSPSAFIYQGKQAKYLVRGGSRAIVWAPPWGLRTRYEPGDIMQYNGRFYRWIWETSGLGFTPGSSTTRWEEITTP